MNEGREEFNRYAVRLTDCADREAIEALLRLEDLEGESHANAWYAGLRSAIGTLSEQPRRYAVQERDSRLIGREIRRLLYRRTAGSAAYHALYLVEEGSEDGPRVIIIHIRHASSRPLTAQESRDLRAGL